MAEYSVETFEDFMRDATPLTQELWMEVFRDRLEPDMEAFVEMEALGSLRIYVARDIGKVVGFVMMLVQDNLMQKTVREANAVGMGVLPAYRKGWFAKNLISFAEEGLASEGVQSCSLSAAEGSDVGSLLCGLGYAPVETIYEKLLRKEQS